MLSRAGNLTLTVTLTLVGSSPLPSSYLILTTFKRNHDRTSYYLKFSAIPLREHVKFLSRHTRWVAGAVGLPFSTQGDPHLNLRGYFIHHLRGLRNLPWDASELTEEALDGDRRLPSAAAAVGHVVHRN